MSEQQEDYQALEQDFLTILLENNDALCFRTEKELEKFINAERLCIANLQEELKTFDNLPPWRPIRGVLQKVYSIHFDALEKILSAVNDNLNPQKAIHEYLKIFNFMPVVFSTSRIGKLIWSSSEGSKATSMMLFAYLAPQDGSWPGSFAQVRDEFFSSLSSKTQGTFPITHVIGNYQRKLANLQVIGSNEVIQDYLKRLHEADQKKDKILDLMQEAGISHCNWIEAKRDEFSLLIDEHLKKANQGLDEQASEFQSRAYRAGLKALTSARKRLKKVRATEKAISEKVELNSAVSYWGSKFTDHEKEQGTWQKALWWAVGVTAIGPILIMALSYELALKVGYDKEVLGFVNPLVASAGIISLSLCTYAIRFFSRQYASAKHLMLEAKERKTMILTYLALMLEDKLKDSEDRKVALDMLFRSSPTGVIADSHPVMPTDSLIKIIEKRL